MRARFSLYHSNLKPLTMLAVVFTCFCCEEVIDSPFEIVESKLVLASTFAPNEAVTVRLSATQPVTGELRTGEVANAKVVLFDGPNLIEQLAYIPGAGDATGVYRTLDFHPQVNHRYTLHASADGFTPALATSKIPTSITISSLEVTGITQRSMLNSRLYDYTLRVDYADPEETLNYYDLRISQEVIPFRVSADGDTTFYASILKSVQPPTNIIRTSSVGGQASVLLRDKANADGITVQLQSVIDPSQEILGSIVAELRTVSEEYFLFQASLQDEGTVSSGILEPRVNFYTNVTAGVTGVFAGYSSNVRTLVFRGR